MSPLSPSILLSIFVLTFGIATNKTLIENVTKQSNCSGKSPLEAQARRSSTPGGKVIPVVFGPLPKGSEYATGAPDSAKLNPYRHIKEILNFIYPSPFPADLYKDILQENIPYPALVVKILEMELGFLAVLFLSLFLALVVPAMVISLCSTDPSPPPTCAPKCKRRTLVFCLQILLCFLLMGGAAMIWTNEECSKGVAKSPEFLNDFFKDSKQFFEDGTDKLKHLLTDSYDQAISPATHDLNGNFEVKILETSSTTDNLMNFYYAENLIGRPIQVGLILETGLDTALDSLVEIAAGGKEVCSQVSEILRETSETEQLMSTMEGKLQDLRDQIRLIKKHCLAVDKPLCDLVSDQLIDLRFTTKMGYAQRYSINFFFQISDNKQFEIGILKQGGIDTLSASVLEANAVFTGLPIKIDKETKAARIATLNEISKKKTALAKNAGSLDVIKTRTGMALYDLKSTITPQFEHVIAIEHWRWLVGLVAGLVVIYIWALMTGATCCGCCGADKSSSPTLTITLILTAIVSVLLWILSFMVMYIGGHGETCICRTMDEDNYNTLSQFIDTIMNIDNVEEDSYISEVIHRNGSIGLSLGTILSDCKRNESIYKTFNLNLILDIEKETNVKKWNSINSELENIETDLLYTQFFNPKLLNKLSDLQHGLLVNVTSFRTQLMSPISTDLESAIKQILSISKQINDMSTSSHLESLAIKSRNLLFPFIQELESKKENLVYRLTALELKINPLLKQVNQSLSHMKAVQYYISNHGSTLAQQNLKSYTKRIQNYFEQYRNFVNHAIDSNETSCRDFWNMFESLRLQVCRKTIDPLNGFWFATVWCLFLFMLITPIGIKLIHYYNLKAGTSSEMTTSRSYVSRQGSTSSPERGSPDTENSPTDNW